MSFKKKPAGGEDLWGTSSIEQVARKDLDIVARNHRRARVFRALIWMGIPAFLMVAIFAISEFTKNQEQDQSASTVSVTSAPGRPEATIAVEEWLATDPSPLPGGQILGWEGAEEIDWPIDEATFNPQTDERLTYYLHNFVVFTPPVLDDHDSEVRPERFFDTSVLVALSPTRGVQVLTEPSLTPVAPSVESFTTMRPWPNTKPGTLPTPAVEAVDNWAKAYVGSEPVALRLATGDPNTNSAYTPLGGVKNYEVSIENAAYLLEPGSSDSTSSTMVATVRISLDRVGDAEYLSSQPAVTLDVLITGADAGAPSIVAWGPAGTGHLLTPYENSVIIERLTKDKGGEDGSQSR